MQKPTYKINGYIIQHEGSAHFIHTPKGTEKGGHKHPKSATYESCYNGEG
jgi:hypothetical protein